MPASALIIVLTLVCSAFPLLLIPGWLGPILAVTAIGLGFWAFIASEREKTEQDERSGEMLGILRELRVARTVTNTAVTHSASITGSVRVVNPAQEAGDVAQRLLLLLMATFGDEAELTLEYKRRWQSEARDVRDLFREHSIMDGELDAALDESEPNRKTINLVIQRLIALANRYLAT